MPSIHRDEEYMGQSNKEIKRLDNEILSHEKKIKEAKEQIDKIQSECDHYYQFSSSGMYEDNYVCKHCGHETER